MFGKFFASAFTGSMMASGADVFALWGYVIANAAGSRVELNPKLISVLIGTTPEKIEESIKFLCAPDPNSRSKNDDGCRLIREGEYQYFVPNHEKYRSIRDEEGRREYNRLKQQEHRSKLKGDVKRPVNDSQSLLPKSTMSAHTEAEADTETEAETEALKNQTKSKPLPSATRPVKEKKVVTEDETALQRVCHATWGEYVIAYQDRYGVPPVRNPKVSSQVKQFCQRVPGFEAPAIAAFYVTHNAGFYVSNGHSVGLLLKDAEKLRTEWATNQTVTQSQARQVDATAGRGNVWKKVIAEITERERNEQAIQGAQ